MDWSSVDAGGGEPEKPPKKGTANQPWFAAQVAAVVCWVGGGSLMLSAVMEYEYARRIDSTTALCFLGGCAAIGAGYAFQNQVNSLSLSGRVRSLNPVVGKSLGLIEKKLGPWKDRETSESGELLLTWSSPGYRVTLGFRDGECVRVAKEKFGG